MKRYIEGIAEDSREKIAAGNGYYHDIIQLKKEYEINAIGTTNYNSFIEEIINQDIAYLNGSVHDYYDPYLNKIVSAEENQQKNILWFHFYLLKVG